MNKSPLQVVVFHLEGKSLALDILKVREILRLVEITPMPKMPAFALGVINLRGRIMPIIDIREKLHLPAGQLTAKTCIILVGSKDQTLGFLVDDVTEVRSLPADAIEKSESGPDWIRSDLFVGVGKLKEGLLVVIDSDNLLSPSEKKQLKQVSTGPIPFQD